MDELQTATPRKLSPKRNKRVNLYKSYDSNKRKLVTFNSNGAIYFPKLIREIFKGYHFAIEVSEGKIVLDPVRVEDFEEVEEE
ncbi:hypothetical protein [Archaeoglobus sp.]|uniref:hypothetical protein n=1 Tax=Archaeoglobus sp. TaxID=1872626 RepID=UPI0025BE503C|nr:hypothetical protein [Archaeoglobus sp.]